MKKLCILLVITWILSHMNIITFEHHDIITSRYHNITISQYHDARLRKHKTWLQFTFAVWRYTTEGQLYWICLLWTDVYSQEVTAYVSYWHVMREVTAYVSYWHVMRGYSLCDILTCNERGYSLNCQMTALTLLRNNTQLQEGKLCSRLYTLWHT
jgi:hypothetical protein